ncbi:hypothetical protein CVU75_01120 [Candidatus Dependentiae bacterium HGW-Dependentiae-1]|nr:MAG: hypothetical protein CVU75_01120 [Candidatus Dependentiae bacterium HGW-Dependentiae-1]
MHTPEQSAQTPMITVWVHGTRLLKLLVHPIDEYVHAAPPTGLRLATNLSHKHRLLTVARALSTVDPLRFPLDHFYVFGWSGNLSFNEREKAAQKLYTELKKVLADYRATHGVTPRIRIITHSHGGNVALNLAKIHDPADTISIAQTIFLANPVQKETADYARDPFFEKIYALYSTMDNLQVMDPQGLYKTKKNGKRHLKFSDRRFPLQKNLRQAKIKINGHGIPHIGFITRGFINYLPTILDTLDAWEVESPALPNQERLLTLHT